MSKQTLRKAFLLGLGVTLLTKDVVEKEIKKFMREYKITEKDARMMSRRMLTKGKKYQADLLRTIKKTESEFRKELKKRV
ncbi:hypothetical protein CMO92_03690 [Candidatus Woesearchaeota archaeon]|nr:hypothetical protein [Candidatus Woesearchaeota archaeon]|tara:strand:+ start:1624 stop:1863 length:240 start_codon:yes stop_codon:yes gene_type:complete